MHKITIIILGVSFFIHQSVSAASPKECAQIANDIERLDCYDTLFGHLDKSDKKALKANKPIKRENDKLEEIESDFDAPKRPVGIAKKDKAKDALERAFGEEKKRHNIRTFELSNGQIWRKSETSFLKIKEGDTVAIEKGMFSSYHLSKPDVNRRVNVNRIK